MRDKVIEGLGIYFFKWCVTHGNKTHSCGYPPRLWKSYTAN